MELGRRFKSTTISQPSTIPFRHGLGVTNPLSLNENFTKLYKLIKSLYQNTIAKPLFIDFKDFSNFLDEL